MSLLPMVHLRSGAEYSRVCQNSNGNETNAIDNGTKENETQIIVQRRRQTTVETQRPVETQRQTEIERQKQAEIERQKQAEIERKKQVEIERQKQPEVERQKKKETKEEKERKRKEEEEKERNFGILPRRKKALIFFFQFFPMFLCSCLAGVIIYFDFYIFPSKPRVMNQKKDTFTIVLYVLLGFGYLFFLILGFNQYKRKDYEFNNGIAFIVKIISIYLPLSYICSFRVSFTECVFYAVYILFICCTLCSISMCFDQPNPFVVILIAIIYFPSFYMITYAIMNGGQDLDFIYNEKFDRKIYTVTFFSRLVAMVPSIVVILVLIGVFVVLFNKNTKINNRLKGNNCFSKSIELSRLSLFLIFSFPFAIFVYIVWFFRWICNRCSSNSSVEQPKNTRITRSSPNTRVAQNSQNTRVAQNPQNTRVAQDPPDTEITEIPSIRINNRERNLERNLPRNAGELINALVSDFVNDLRNRRNGNQ